MTPTIIGDCILYNADCLDVLPTLSGVDAVVTDPPYGIALRNNCKNGQTPKRKERSFHVVGDNDAAVALAVLEWAAKADLLTVAFASPWKPWPGEWRNLIAWDKGGAMGGGGDIRTCLKRTWELVQVARNGPMNGCRDVSVWRHTMTGADTADHICAKPVDLMARLIERFTSPGQMILDPFMGSGSTAVACVQTGRRFVGVELDRAHFETSCDRIRKAYAETPLLQESA